MKMWRQTPKSNGSLLIRWFPVIRLIQSNCFSSMYEGNSPSSNERNIQQTNECWSNKQKSYVYTIHTYFYIGIYVVCMVYRFLFGLYLCTFPFSANASCAHTQYKCLTMFVFVCGSKEWTNWRTVQSSIKSK